MAEKITLEIPDDVLQAARRIAQETGQSLEDVLVDHLRGLSMPLPAEPMPPMPLPPDDLTELDALEHLSDDALLNLVEEQLAYDIQERGDTLMEKYTAGTITGAEHRELEEIRQREERLTQRRTQAATILRERGYSVE